MNTTPEPPPKAPRPDAVDGDALHALERDPASERSEQTEGVGFTALAPDSSTTRPQTHELAALDASIFDTDQIDAVSAESSEASAVGESTSPGILAGAAPEAATDGVPDVATDGDVEAAAGQEPVESAATQTVSSLPTSATPDVVDVDPTADADDALTAVDGADDEPSSDEPHIVDAHDEESEPAPASPRKRPPTWLLVVMALLVLAVPVLGYAGFQLVDKSTRGQVLSGVSSPTDPGYEALLEPTPTALLIVTDDEGTARSLTILSLSGAQGHGGAVVSLPVQTRLAEEAFGQRTYGDVASNVTPDSAGTTIGGQLSLSFTEVVKVDEAMLASIVAPAGPLTIENPVQVTSPDGETFAAGSLTLEPDQMADYLESADADGSEIARLDRAQLVWSAWFEQVDQARETPGIVPGEAEVGLGRFVRGLSAGTVEFGTLPVVEADPIGDEETFRVDEQLARLMLTNAIPFPVAGGGERLTVRVLNGTGSGPIPQSVMQRLVFGGAQVTVIGNNDSFDEQTTTFTYAAAENGKQVKSMAKTLGRGTVVLKPEADSGADVTVVLGSDVMESPPSLLTPEEVDR